MRCFRIILFVLSVVGFFLVGRGITVAATSPGISNEQTTEALIGEIVAEDAKGTEALEVFAKANRARIPADLIRWLSQIGAEKRLEKMIRVAEILAKANGDDKLLGDVLFRYGYYCHLVSRNRDALDLYEKALPFYVKTDSLMGQGDVYWSMGDVHFYTGNNAKALELYNKALPFFVKADSPLGQGNVYKSMGHIHLSTGNNHEALELYEKALLLYVKADDPRGQGNVYQSMGDIHFYTGNNAKTLELYEKALPFYVKADSPMGQGNVYKSMGDVHFYAGNDAKACPVPTNIIKFS